MIMNQPTYMGTLSMTSHYTNSTYQTAKDIRLMPKGINEMSSTKFDLAEFNTCRWLFNYYEAMSENNPTIDKMLGLLSRLSCAASMMSAYPLYPGEIITFQNSGILTNEYLGYPKTNTFTLRITNMVEELVFYNGVYFDRDHEFVVHLPGTGIELR